MIQFHNWCSVEEGTVGPHQLNVLTGVSAALAEGVAVTAAAVPGHYAAEEHLAHILRRLGKSATAKLICDKLPTTKSIRSGDLGEIFATEWIDLCSGGYRAPIKRLRWKDHRNMAMRGDDVIGLLWDVDAQRLLFLKTEAKSRVALTRQVLDEARVGLDKDSGFPSAHALTFIADRLLESGNHKLADAIYDALLKHGILNCLAL